MSGPDVPSPPSPPPSPPPSGSSSGAGETLDAQAFEARGFAHLLVVEPESSRRVDLPAVGEVLIGRDATCGIRLEHKSVSRRHARLAAERGSIRVSDEGSHNGTRVNGDRVHGTRTLASGDTISVGEVVLVLHFGARRAGPRELLPEAAWRDRLNEEVERALTYGRALAVVVLAGQPETGPGRAAELLAGDLRLIDVAGMADDGSVWLLLPETGGDAAARAAARAVELLGPEWPATRAGVAICPLDACDADALLYAARRAARTARAGHTATGAEGATTLDLDGRRVLIADPAMQRQFDLIRRLAATNLPVLICGETGVGKENAAFAVHHGSPRRGKPFLPVNCAAIPETLVESTLFGHEKGAFSGAVATRAGLLESAAGGTVFLDEIGDLPLAAQAKLLRVLDGHAVTRVGDARERTVDVRMVAATHRNLEQEVAAGRFREDLYFRLGAKVVLPPLRERPCEIPLLAREFLGQACARLGRTPMVITPAAMQVLCMYAWPGNVRDLRLVLDVVAATVEDDRVEPSDLPERIGAPHAPEPAPEPEAAPVAGVASEEAEAGARRFQPIASELDALMRQRMIEALEAAGGVRTRAAALLSMPIRTFTYKLRQFGLKDS